MYLFHHLIKLSTWWILVKFLIYHWRGMLYDKYNKLHHVNKLNLFGSNDCVASYNICVRYVTRSSPKRNMTNPFNLKINSTISIFFYKVSLLVLLCFLSSLLLFYSSPTNFLICVFVIDKRNSNELVWVNPNSKDVEDASKFK